MGNFTRKSFEGFFFESLNADTRMARRGEFHIPLMQIFVKNEKLKNKFFYKKYFSKESLLTKKK
jgi:hypothetical protein